LDKETTGLLLLTDLPDVVHRLTSPRHKVPKVYRAVLDRVVPGEAAERFAAGALMLPGEEHPCAPAALEVLGPREARLTLTEGRYHQVRRMFAVLDATVVALHRESFGSLTLEGLAPGQWRELPPGTFAAG
jgi:16S rRNA pseudouridine516 synthase